ncbi:hypothetical protein [Halobellus rarus]|uniref:Uncharacterized protein n=1 Tax=Halobellus rarus TaxID=1126237 RepID=A0ABD6CIC8_9EURY|nr:hypothetical protein [Halobellus rarus]
MPQRIHIDDRDSATEPEFYLPAGASPSFIANRLERIWATLFNHGVGPRK